jgi:hypothetical protein
MVMGMREKLVELVSDAELPMKSDGRIIGYYALGFHEALYMADHLIANDVVPVVRCGECKHFCEPFCIRRDDEKHRERINVLTVDYCSYGERRDND